LSWGKSEFSQEKDIHLVALFVPFKTLFDRFAPVYQLAFGETRAVPFIMEFHIYRTDGKGNANWIEKEMEWKAFFYFCVSVTVRFSDLTFYTKELGNKSSSWP